MPRRRLSTDRGAPHTRASECDARSGRLGAARDCEGKYSLCGRLKRLIASDGCCLCEPEARRTRFDLPDELQRRPSVRLGKRLQW
ncbi:unnamed protein product [Plutella xylostella]|uniref:(diamondback moth) hypothetical protein n=1 Tax=Plutella xylostella TaxID=51655 RepID=A0A8S4EF47_PLUXY|nr:unnamed protein product [Plutella xylostella]